MPPQIWRCSVKSDLPFRELVPSPSVDVRFNEQTLALPQGANLAAALLAAGVTQFRQSPVSGATRGPFCMMGACFDCLVEIDGVVTQACMRDVQEGMTITSPAVGQLS